jgi:hypothetical protein
MSPQVSRLDYGRTAGTGHRPAQGGVTLYFFFFSPGEEM